MQSFLELGEDEAALAIAAIREELVRRNKVAVIAVSDARGELIALVRMDGAPHPSIGAIRLTPIAPYALALRRDFFSITWMPLEPLTVWVTRRSAARLHSV